MSTPDTEPPVGNSLPALRMNALYVTLREKGYSYEQIDEIRAAVVATLDNDTRRLGSVCGVDGCRQILTDTSEPMGSNSVRHASSCPEHGERTSSGLVGPSLSLAIEFPPVTS